MTLENNFIKRKRLFVFVFEEQIKNTDRKLWHCPKLDTIKKEQYLWFTGNDSDTIFTTLKPFVADERSDVDSNFNRTIIWFHLMKEWSENGERMCVWSREKKKRGGSLQQTNVSLMMCVLEREREVRVEMEFRKIEKELARGVLNCNDNNLFNFP